MKISQTSSLISFSYLYTLTLAALSVLSPHPANSTLLNSTSGTPNPSHLPDPFQLRIHGTTTSLIFAKYSAPVSPFDLVGIVAKAQYEIVKSVVDAKGDGPIAQPTFEWRHGRLYVRVEHGLDLRWLTMAEALHGVLEFGYTYGFFGCVFTVLSDEAGVVGSGSVGVGYL